MKHLIGLFILIIVIHFDIFSQGTVLDEIEIWPGVGPGSDTVTITENILIRSLSGTCTRNRAMEKITVPTITPVIPDEANGSAFLICPGGAYQRVVYDVEGIDIGNWLNSIGITAFVLKYRLPADDHIDKKNVPLQDAQRAIRYIKANAEQWNLDTSKIGIAGASAGGHVASTLATSFNKECYELKDSVDSISARPYYMFLLYPVVSMESDITHAATRSLLIGNSPSQELIDEFSAEKKVTSLSPKTFLAHANDDSGVSPENSKRLAKALSDSGIVVSLNLYADGGHGVGICKAVGTDFANWTKDFTNWFNETGLTDITASSIKSKKQKSGFNIHSNSASDNIVVSAQFSKTKIVSIIITNNLGQKMLHLSNLPASKNFYKQINVEKFPAGLYHVVLSTDSEKMIKLIMIN